jgi:hypothetical protein
MNPRAKQVLLSGLGLVSRLAWAFFAVIAWAARSDFVFRGCHTMTPEEWVFTANCSDAYAVTWFGGLLALALFAVALWSFWRLRHV